MMKRQQPATCFAFGSYRDDGGTGIDQPEGKADGKGQNGKHHDAWRCYPAIERDAECDHSDRQQALRPDARDQDLVGDLH